MLIIHFGNLSLSEPTPSRRHRRVGSIFVCNYDSAEHKQNQSSTKSFYHSEWEQASLVQKTQLCGVVLAFYKWPVVIPSLQAMFICSRIMIRDGWINDKLLQLYAIWVGKTVAITLILQLELFFVKQFWKNKSSSNML